MKTRVLIFSRVKTATTSLLRFAIFDAGLLQDLSSETLTSFAERSKLKRHETFDWNVGDGGKKCALFEFVSIETTLQLPDHALPLPTHFIFSDKSVSCRWCTFPEARPLLKEGEDRRLLQLAVQFLAAGAVIEDNVMAAPTDEELLRLMKETETDPDFH